MKYSLILLGQSIVIVSDIKERKPETSLVRTITAITALNARVLKFRYDVALNNIWQSLINYRGEELFLEVSKAGKNNESYCLHPR